MARGAAQRGRPWSTTRDESALADQTAGGGSELQGREVQCTEGQTMWECSKQQGNLSCLLCAVGQTAGGGSELQRREVRTRSNTMGGRQTAGQCE